MADGFGPVVFHVEFFVVADGLGLVVQDVDGPILLAVEVNFLGVFLVFKAKFVEPAAAFGEIGRASCRERVS
jgi:hypothetical protein